MNKATFHPTLPEVITDDARAQELALYAGVWDTLATMPAARDLCIAPVVNHPKHWLIFARVRNNPDPEENGFIVFSYPKASVPYSRVILTVAAMLQGATNVHSTLAALVPWE